LVKIITTWLLCWLFFQPLLIIWNNRNYFYWLFSWLFLYNYYIIVITHVPDTLSFNA
jgi:hypothetical protein